MIWSPLGNDLKLTPLGRRNSPCAWLGGVKPLVANAESHSVMR